MQTLGEEADRSKNEIIKEILKEKSALKRVTVENVVKRASDPRQCAGSWNKKVKEGNDGEHQKSSSDLKKGEDFVSFLTTSEHLLPFGDTAQLDQNGTTALIAVLYVFWPYPDWKSPSWWAKRDHVGKAFSIGAN